MVSSLSFRSPCVFAASSVALFLHHHPSSGTRLAPLPHLEPFSCRPSLVCTTPSGRFVHPCRAFDSLDLESPPIDYDLQSMLRDAGAEFSEDGVVLSFGNDDEAFRSVTSGVSVAEMSHIGRLRVTGDDRIRFLHNQSTADFQVLNEGEGCNTVFVTPTARTIDLAAAWVMKRSIILFISQNMRQHLLQLLNKYIFFADKVEVEDITEKTLFFTITGPKSDQLMEQLNMKDIVGKPYGTHQHYAVEGTPVTVGVGNMLSKTGYSLLLSTDTAGLVWETLLQFGAVPMGANCWEHLRIKSGRPAAGIELTDEFNVLEAGLWETISLSKGCYIGQETVARLITYNGVKQHLWGLILDGYVDPGTTISLDGSKVGKLTSCSRNMENGSVIGLGYVSKRAGGQGLHVQVGERSGTVISVPFVTQSLASEPS